MSLDEDVSNLGTIEAVENLLSSTSAPQDPAEMSEVKRFLEVYFALTHESERKERRFIREDALDYVENERRPAILRTFIRTTLQILEQIDTAMEKSEELINGYQHHFRAARTYYRRFLGTPPTEQEKLLF